MIRMEKGEGIYRNRTVNKGHLDLHLHLIHCVAAWRDTAHALF